MYLPPLHNSPLPKTYELCKVNLNVVVQWFGFKRKVVAHILKKKTIILCGENVIPFVILNSTTDNIIKDI